jgi:hypothetical protein
MVLNEYKNPHFCYDATTTRKPTIIVMNQVTPVRREAPITFGKVKQQLFADIYNTRISYPLAVILLAVGDIKSCFCFAQIHANLMGAFGFLPTTVTTAMVFGSTASTSSWEPFRLAIESLSKVFANCPDLVQKHKKYLDMIG